VVQRGIVDGFVAIEIDCQTKSSGRVLLSLLGRDPIQRWHLVHTMSEKGNGARGSFGAGVLWGGGSKGKKKSELGRKSRSYGEGGLRRWGVDGRSLLRRCAYRACCWSGGKVERHEKSANGNSAWGSGNTQRIEGSMCTKVEW